MICLALDYLRLMMQVCHWHQSVSLQSSPCFPALDYLRTVYLIVERRTASFGPVSVLLGSVLRPLARCGLSTLGSVVQASRAVPRPGSDSDLARSTSSLSAGSGGCGAPRIDWPPQRTRRDARAPASLESTPVPNFSKAAQHFLPSRRAVTGLQRPGASGSACRRQVGRPSRSESYTALSGLGAWQTFAHGSPERLCNARLPCCIPSAWPACVTMRHYNTEL